MSKDQANKTHDKFKKRFAATYVKLCENEDVTARNSSYHQANLTTEVSSALDNSAMTAVNEKKVVEELTQDDVDLMQAINILTKQVWKLQIFH
eukprot:2588959-Ditylum_brightwellii.AAC.1